ncbi:MAG: DUF1266 domain-containing protein [Pseudomonadota bacterium]|nr:DUF1266 domain-containing protein [Pseudomonadota bacterium]
MSRSIGTADARRAHGYQPRNVVNAPHIRRAIDARAQRRQDPPEIRDWLGNHFFRWCVGSFAHTVPVDSVRRWALCQPELAPPAWFVRHLQAQEGAAAEPPHYIDPEHPRLIDAERQMLEFLHALRGRRLAGKLHKITYFEALARWHQDHERMARQRRAGWAPSSPEAFRVELETAQGRFVEFVSAGDLLRSEMAYESFHMQHCVGEFEDRENLRGGYGDFYARSIEQGQRRIFSLRDAGNQPHVTLSLIQELGEWRLEQVKGKQNRPPSAKYVPGVLSFLNHLALGIDGVADCAALGLMHLPAEAASADAPRIVPFHAHLHLPQAQRLLAEQAALIARHPNPGVREYWLALGGHPWVAARAMLGGAQAPPPTVLAAAVLGLSRDDLKEIVEADADPPSGWLAALLAQAPTAADTSVPAPITPPRRRWLGLLPPAAPASDARHERRQRWAFAVADLLYLRQGISVYPRHSGFALGLSASAQATLRERVERDLDFPADAGERAEWLQKFWFQFFGVPQFCDGDFMAHCAGAGIAAYDLLAFAAARQTFVLRVLTACGHLPEARAERFLRLNAQRVQDCFDDWRGFAQAYARGRGAWLSWQQNRNLRRIAEVEAEEYLEGFASNWKHLPWREDALVTSDEARGWVGEALWPLSSAPKSSHHSEESTPS